MEWIVISIYWLALTLICCFSFMQFNITCYYLKAKKRTKKTVEKERKDLKQYPFVTVQLPIYNEQYVVERLIDAVVNLDYPKDKLEIQILDDSDDLTVTLITKKIEALLLLGIDIKHIRRNERVGYKAGALQYGLNIAKGEFIAIFDADFLPFPDFLFRTLLKFSSENIGMVQTKWTYLNKNYNALTKIQAFWLEAHFTVEQKGRAMSGSFINFNGTAGIWRKSTIIDSGGWQFDTITEDLDLSYRAQLKGWKFVYSEEIESPSELPILFSALKSQQFRWNKGGAETARKNLKALLLSKIKWKHKMVSVFHLLNSSVFSLLLVVAILSIPSLYIKSIYQDMYWLFNAASVFLLGFLAMTYFYWVAAKTSAPASLFWHFFVNFPRFLTFSSGMSLHNSIAFFEGYLGIKTPFVRTPKFNVRNKTDGRMKKKRVNHALIPTTFIEGLLCLYFLFGIGLGFQLHDFGLMGFHLMFFLGFGYVFWLSLKSERGGY